VKTVDHRDWKDLRGWSSEAQWPVHCTYCMDQSEARSVCPLHITTEYTCNSSLH